MTTRLLPTNYEPLIAYLKFHFWTWGIIWWNIEILIHLQFWVPKLKKIRWTSMSILVLYNTGGISFGLWDCNVQNEGSETDVESVANYSYPPFWVLKVKMDKYTCNHWVYQCRLLLFQNARERQWIKFYGIKIGPETNKTYIYRNIENHGTINQTWQRRVALERGDGIYCLKLLPTCQCFCLWSTEVSKKLQYCRSRQITTHQNRLTIGDHQQEQQRWNPVSSWPPW